MRVVSAISASTLATLVIAASPPSTGHTVDWGLSQGDKRKLIPAQFQGEWDASQKACRSYVSDMRGYIGANRFRFGDSVSAVKKVVRKGERSITLLVETRSDGDPWSGEMQLELSPTGDQITLRQDDWSEVRYRCPLNKPDESYRARPVLPEPIPVPKAIQMGPVFNGVGFGSCLDAEAEESINWKRVRLLDAAEIEVPTSTGAVKAELDGQWLILRAAKPSPERPVIILNIGDLIGENGQRSDVAVKFAWLDSLPLLYWRETFQHRRYRQGFQRLLPEGIVKGKESVLAPICNGHGGLEKSYVTN